jgi:hypothetical protein
VYAACAVLALVGVLVLAAVGFLVYAAVIIFRELDADRGRPDQQPPPAEVGNRGTGWVRPDPVTPTKLADARDKIVLDGEFDATCRGAGGRYLFLRNPPAKKLHVFDPVEAKVVHEIPLDDPKTLVAAGAAKLFLLKPRTGQLERYDLRTWQKEQESAKGAVPQAEYLFTGWAADGPVYAAGEGLGFVQPVDPRALAAGPRKAPVPDVYRPPFRVSADGRLLGAGREGKSGAVLRLAPEGLFDPVALGPEGQPVGHVTPAPDGRWAYTAFGPFRLDRGEYRPWVLTAPGRPSAVYSFPAAQGGDLFLSLRQIADTKWASGPLRVHPSSDPKRLTPGSELDTVGPLRRWDRTDAETDRPLTEEKFHLWPAAGLLAVLTPANDETTIELFKVDVGAALRKLNREFAAFGTDPPTTAVRGTVWEYRYTVWADQTVPVRIAAAPEGMVIGKLGINFGTIRWPVPKDFPDREVEVRMEAGPEGTPAVQTFRLSVVDSR